MQVEVRYPPPHRREGGTLKNVAWENLMQLEPQPLRKFLFRLIKLHNQNHMKDAFLSVEARGHHAATCRSKF